MLYLLKTCLFVVMVVVVIISSASLSADTVRVPEQHKTIQAAIDVAKPGDTVLVSPGTYRERIRLKPDVTLKSAGADTQGKFGLVRAEHTIIDGGKVGKGPGVMMARGAILDGFTLTNVGSYDEAVWKTHHATQGELLADDQGALVGKANFPAIAVIGVDCTIRSNIVHHNGHVGIGIRGVKNRRTSPHVHHNIVYRNMGGGIASADESTSIIEANRCFQNLRGGIGNRNASPLVINNVCYENVRAGIGNREGAKPILRGNKCYKNRRAGIGIRMKGTSPIVEGNDCFENDMAGIGNRDGATPIIRGNRCYKNKMAGIGSRDEARAIIENNECFENDMAGIGSRLGAAPVIRNNRCYKNKMAGIGSRENAKPIIVENDCYENKMAGIGTRTDAAPIIRGNRCHKNDMAGIGSRLGARPVIADNECFENKMAGIGSKEGTRPVICNNRCFKNRMAGIGSRAGAQPVIVNNESRQNNMAGLGVRGRDTVAVLVGNKCADNRLVAIGLPDGATAFIHGNDLSRTGGMPPLVAVKGGATAFVSHNSIKNGGVAGVLAEGDITIVGNRFQGKGKGQGSAVWVWPKSNVNVYGNHFAGYRNAVNVRSSKLTAVGNVVRDFQGAAITVDKSSPPARVIGTIAVSNNPKDVAVKLNGDNGAWDNLLKSPEQLTIAEKKAPFVWPLVARKSDGAAYHPLIGSGKSIAVTDGNWKYVATYGKTITYKLFDMSNDPQEKTDLSSRLEHIAFRLRGLLERREASEDQAQINKTVK